MLGWMDAEALRRTLTTGRVTFWSRSRQEYWRKGDTSGHTQHVHGARLDCDGDAVLIQVEQVGPACHTGTRTCFDADDLEPVRGRRPRDPPGAPARGGRDRARRRARRHLVDPDLAHVVPPRGAEPRCGAGAAALPVLAPLSLAVLALGGALSIVGLVLRYVFGALTVADRGACWRWLTARSSSSGPPRPRRPPSPTRPASPAAAVADLVARIRRRRGPP